MFHLLIAFSKSLFQLKSWRNILPAFHFHPRNKLILYIDSSKFWSKYLQCLVIDSKMYPIYVSIPYTNELDWKRLLVSEINFSSSLMLWLGPYCSSQQSSFSLNHLPLSRISFPFNLLLTSSFPSFFVYVVCIRC